uniref:carbohydrate binding domain-containing protein n=1 Tax=Flavobacterium TaxID=237 RepID=UPI0023F4ACBF
MKKFTLLIAILFSNIGISQNLLTNGDFENGTANWSFGPQGTVSNGEAFYNETNSAGNLWDTQLVQGGMSFTSGTSYTLTFKARAASNRNITVAIQNVGIWNDQFRQSYALTTSMQTFTATFSAPFTNGNVQIGFLMAGQGSTASVYYDDVVIEVNSGGGGGPTPPAQPVGLVVNTPTSSSVFLACGPNNAGSGDIVYRLFYSPTATAPVNPTTATQYTFGSTPGDGNGVSAFGFVLTGLNSGTPYTFWLYQFDSSSGLYSPPTSVTATTTSSGSVPQPVGFVAQDPRTSTSIRLAVGPNNTGGNIVYRLFYSPTATAPVNPLTASQYNFGSTAGDNNGNGAFGFNIGGLSPSTAYTFWLYQFDTSSSIYSTPAIASNSTLNPPPVLIPPTTNAPVPTRNAANVVSVFSNSYSNIANNYDPNWGQSGHTLVNSAFIAVPDSGNTILHYPNFNYQGTQLNASNLSDMEFLHVDLWTNAPTSTAIIQVSPINAGSGPSEVLVTINHVQGQWVSVDLPKSLFTGMTWDNVIQMKFAANGPGSTTPIDIYLDNIYFWNNPGVSTDATLSDLQVDFAPVDGFSSNQLSYTYSVPFGTTEIPQITSATPNSGAASTVITQSTAIPGSATVLVTSEDPSVQLTYTVNFAFPPPPAQPVGFVALNPTSSSVFLACGPNNVNGTIIYRLFYSPTASAPVNPTTAAEYTFGSTAGDGSGASPFGFNLSGLSSFTNYTFWLYQYNSETNQFSSPATASLTTLCQPLDWYLDNDGDSYGNSSTLVTACTAPGSNYVTQGGDCNDNNSSINPGATEI